MGMAVFGKTYRSIAYLAAFGIALSSGSAWASPSFQIAEGEVIKSSCVGTSPAVNLTVVPSGLDPRQNYEIWVTESFSDFVSRIGKAKLEASASIFTGRQRRAQYRLEDVWPGEYDIVLIDKSRKDSAGRPVAVSMRRLSVKPPAVDVRLPQHVQGNVPFEVDVKHLVGPARLSPFILEVRPRGVSDRDAETKALRVANIPRCASMTIKLRGLAAGTYDLNIYQYQAVKRSNSLFQKSFEVGGSSKSSPPPSNGSKPAAPGSKPHLSAPMRPGDGHSAFQLIFPLDCADAACSLRYDAGAWTHGMMTSILDHSMKQGGNGYWQYGSQAKGSADRVIVAADGSKFSGRVKPGDETCVSGAFGTTASNGLNLSKLINDGGCGPGFVSYDEHPGYDFHAGSGSEVRAAAGGTVLGGQGCILANMGYSCREWGFVGIDHGNGYVTQYGHLSEIRVVPGQTVEKGDPIGLSGNTAPVNLGPHLHFEVLYRSDGGYLIVDPYGWNGPGIDPLYSAPKIQPKTLWAPRSAP